MVIRGLDQLTWDVASVLSAFFTASLAGGSLFQWLFKYIFGSKSAHWALGGLKISTELIAGKDKDFFQTIQEQIADYYNTNIGNNKGDYSLILKP